MKKVKLIIAALSSFCLMTSANVFADGFAPGEGLYVGLNIGHNAGNVRAKVAAAADGNAGAVTAEMTEGGIGLEGIEGGGYMGYGYKMGDLYAGFEIGMNGGGGQFEITTSRTIEIGVTGYASDVTAGKTGDADQHSTRDLYEIDKITAKTKWTAGGGARLGYYVNNDTLVAFKGGLAASKFEVDLGGVHTEEYYGGGPLFGFAVDSRLAAIDPNLSIRFGWDYIDFLTAPISGIGTNVSTSDDYNSEITGSAYSARLGLTYSFLDVNSLF